MPKVSGVIEEVNEEDEQLRREFEEFGETLKDKITEKNRPLLVKKLNHLRARRRMSEKLSQSVIKVSPKQPGRGKKGRSARNKTSREAALDDELGGDQLNDTFSISHTVTVDEPPVKRKQNSPGVSNTSAPSEGPYAVLARKRGATNNQKTMQYSAEPSQAGSRSMLQDDVVPSTSSFSSDSHDLQLPARSDQPRRGRGRTRTVDDVRGGRSGAAKVSREVESADQGDVQPTSALTKRKARASAVPTAAKLPHGSTPEEDVGETSSVSESSVNGKLVASSAKERGRSVSRGQLDEAGDLSKIAEDVRKQGVSSRIPKLARFPTPPSRQVRISASLSSERACNLPYMLIEHSCRIVNDCVVISDWAC